VQEIDPQWLFNGLFTIIGTLGGWLLNNIRDAIRDLQRQDADLSAKVQGMEVLVAGNYVKREDMDKMLDAVFRKLDKIEAKLDAKADK